MKKSLLVHTDGGARGNPGPAAVGVYITDEVGRELVKFGKTTGEMTNNQAEYQAVIEALEWIKDNIRFNLTARYKKNANLSGELDVKFFLDSSLVVNQLNGLFKIKENHLRDLIIQVRQKEQEIGGNVSYQFVNRDKNKTADFLVNQALDSSLNPLR